MSSTRPNAHTDENSRRLGKPLLIYAILVPMAIIFAFPFLWMILTSFKTMPEINSYPISWLPSSLQWSNYVDAFTLYLPFPQLVLNTLLVATLVIVGTLFSCSLVAYGFAHIEFPGRDALFTLMMATMMIPFMVQLIPLFLVYRELGWLNTLQPLWVPAFFGTPFYIFMMRQFFRSIPVELMDAARIDGCNEFGIWWRIMLPLSYPVLGVTALFSFQGVWNQFTEPLIFINDPEKYTVMMGIWYIISAPYQRPWNHLMAASTVVILPMILVFVLSQRSVTQGISVTGIKA